MKINNRILYIPIGISGSGKSTFCEENFTASQIVSSDWCRDKITDDETNQKVNQDAFDMFHFMIEKRMKWGRIVVADATNLNIKARKKLIFLADKFGYIRSFILMDIELSE